MRLLQDALADWFGRVDAPCGLAMGLQLGKAWTNAQLGYIRGLPIEPPVTHSTPSRKEVDLRGMLAYNGPVSGSAERTIRDELSAGVGPTRGPPLDDGIRFRHR